MKIIPQLPNLEITTETIQEIKDIDLKKFKKTEAYQKYCTQAEKRRRQLKKEKRIKWWKNNWIGVVTLIATILTLIATVLFGLLQILK